MEKEISSGTMLGIVLIALAAVIGLGFGVFSIAKGVANEGTVGVQDNLNTVTDSAFEDYNDKIVTGTQVKSAVQNFEGKSVAILIHTTAMDKGVKSYNGRNAITTTTGEGSNAVTVTTGGLTCRSIGGKDYVNYNALLAADSSATGVENLPKGSIVKGEGTILHAGEGTNAATLKDGVLTTSDAFALDVNGKVLFDYAIGGMSRTGNCEYVSTSSKFEANLIRDTSGTNIGIMFTQLAQ